ncbi:MAG: ATP-binding cassette domain-containing protein, partial [Actinomycetota bacterium]|nr:ATP-binding cassette domain-containing protein [Actinomycetota bacterium]
MTPALTLRDLTVAYGAEPVVRGVSLQVAPDEVVALLGPSGSGKSTLLAAVAGFIQPRDGQVLLGDKVMSGPGASVPPEGRDVAVVFQHYALWPHLTAAETVAYPLRRRGVGA